MDGGDCDDDDDDDDAEHANSLKPALPTSEQTSPFNVPSSSSSSRSSLVATTVALCLCMLTHSYLLISVFPYSGYMVVALHPSEDVTTDTAGSYAGWIAASFMAGRASTSYFWGLAADCYGRTTVLYLSLGLSAVCTLGFGLSPTFGSAVTLRFLLGASNGIMPTIKTAVSELATNEQQETTIMSTVVGFWGWGFLLSPALSGALADPIRQYPHAAVWQNTDSLAYRVLSKFPFFLPNLLGAFFCVCGTLTVAAFVRETLPAEHQRSLRYMGKDVTHAMWNTARALFTRRWWWWWWWWWCLYRRSVPHRYSTVKHHESSEFQSEGDGTGETEAAPSTDPESSISMSSLWARPATRSVLILYWAYSFVSLTMDEVLPLFCMSPHAGLGLSEGSIGQILSLTGLLFALGQYGAQQALYQQCGLAGAIRWGTALSAPTIFLLPLVLLWNPRPVDKTAALSHVTWNATTTNNNNNMTHTTMAPPNSTSAPEDRIGTTNLTTSTWIYLAVVLALFRVFSLVFFSNISVAINRTVPTKGRATVNGLTVVGGSVAKGLGPIFAGFLVSSSIQWLGVGAALPIFGSVGVLGCGVVVLAFVTMRDDNGDCDERDCANETDDNEEEAESTAAR